MRQLFLRVACVVFVAGCVPISARAAGHGEPGPLLEMRLQLRDRVADLALLSRLEIDVDGVYGSWARVYLLPEEREKLAALGFDLRAVPGDVQAPAPEAAAIPSAYHTYETLTAELQQIAAAHPGIVRLSSIGQSVLGRELWMVKITRNPDVEEDEPELKYVAAMHGDEVVGKEMCLALINLLVDSYGTDPRLTTLVDENEIWILPSMNPDGTALARRYNANNIDLNRNFPDQFDDPVDSTAGRAVEVAHVMNWTAAHSPVLSANFHGGSLVANYPYDATANQQSVYSISPDDALWISLARTYADRNPPMLASNSDPSFTNGICNGSDWYVIYGGMQDWNYVWRGAKEITLEISTAKWPAASQLPQFWLDNRESMLAFLERAREGVRGIVRDAFTQAPLPASIHVLGNPLDTKTDPDVGDYHRVLLPGTYTLEIASPGYVTARVDGISVAAGAAATRADVDLVPLAVSLTPVAARVTGDANEALDPGETADVAVTLKNLGSAATGITGSLVPTTWGLTVTRAGASYPALGAGGSAESVVPHHAVALDAQAVAGSKAGFAMHWSANEASGVSAPFFVPVGAPICTTVVSGDVPRPIADRSTAVSSIIVPFDREISEVNVLVDVTHPYIGDLHVRVVSPAGVPVSLHGRSGGSTDNITGWYDTQRAPFEPLARLNGGHTSGKWKLEVADDVPVNAGTLNGWSLELCGRPFEAQLPAMRIAEVTKTPGGGAEVAWWPYPGAGSYKVYRSPDPRVSESFVNVTAEDTNAADTVFHDTSLADAYWLISGFGANGEGPVTGP